MLAVRLLRRGALLIIAAAFAGCVSAGGSSTQTNRLVIAQSREPNSLNPIFDAGFLNAELGSLAFSYLVASVHDGELTADAVATVPTQANGGISRDGLTVTYHLRPGMRWQDGAPLTARDVIFTHRLIMNPATIVPVRDGFDRVASIVALDPLTVRVRMKKAYAPFLLDFLGPQSITPILPEHLLRGERDLLHARFNTEAIGSGPYRIVSWRRGDRMVLEANPTYFLGAPKIARIELRFVPNSTTQLNLVRTHEVDAILFADAALYPELRKVQNLTVTAEPIAGFDQIEFNLHAPIVSDVRVRRAIAEAIDASVVATKATHGLENSLDAPRALFAWAYDRTAPYAAHDPADAQRLLDAAGWHRNGEGVRTDRNGKKLALTVAIRADISADQTAALLVQQQLHAVGIELSVKTYSGTQFAAAASEGGQILAGHFTMELSGFVVNDDPDVEWLYACKNAAPAGYNMSGYCDKITDELMEAAVGTIDRSARKRYLSQVQYRVATAVPLTFLWQTRQVNAFPQRLHGFSLAYDNPYAAVAFWQLGS
jgi:peptide/nickel transport system substrate-binding protein